MNYTDKQAVQNYIKRNIDAAFDTQLNAYIEAMSRFADGYCSCTLVAETETTRKYDGNGDSVLEIDGAYDITAVTVDGATVTPLKYPANSERTTSLELMYDTFSRGRQNVHVTATFGRFTELPADLKFAVTVLVAGVVNRIDKQTDSIKSEKVGEYQVTYKDEKERADYTQAMNILKMYRPITF